MIIEALSIGLSGAIGAVLGGVWMWWRRPQVRTNAPHEVERAPLFHKHDWHTLGKKNGRVRMWCVTPGCKIERNQDGPE